MTENEFKETCFHMFYGRGNTGVIVQEAIDLLKSINPKIRYPQFSEVCYSLNNDQLIFKVVGKDYFSIPSWSANPVGLACLNENPSKNEVVFLKRLWYSCGNHDLPTQTAGKTFLKWLQKTGFESILRNENQDNLVKIIFERSWLVPKTIRWIPYGISMNDLAGVILSTGDLPDKRFAKKLSKNFGQKQLEDFLKIDKNDWTRE